ncbi:anti-sigma factor [Benzoatithermus flavus]|uniref:Regulator of SigK n=1 Tax=Benzoatithermus flavus TaxID=3108223 RepID=A0ABU8XN33_9PROT
MAGAEDLDALAGEYVLGVLSHDEHLAVQRHLLDDPELARRVAEWEARLAPLADDLPPVMPRPELWWRLRRTIAGRRRPPEPRWWQRLGFWRGWAVAATGAAAGLAALLLLTPPTPGLVAVLTDPQGRPAWVVRVSAEGRGYLAQALDIATPAQRVPELWLLAPGRAPVSLGVLEQAGPSRHALTRPMQLQPGATLAVSLEPPGGSPTGQPTGPVVSTGVLVRDPT